ncbi:MAG: hypothetical protein A2754_03000 [Candidatus Magasanikbacteria bacterium RIFCSPHIGHO2_01_FULL_47_8]|uniref:Uncharacterized protein n=1 Tax=Candidatus Magasanikbacteria bacterium RIFCSPHIGHO2_01_FULL_47_8 TaxID=1798673 RepID=A0A1F6MBA8_9BACT|nr:MAG: hypothetical protein A2754_03000 [Candidatus Magasanikbacteria bacterium RIFCSPHIGHO2_01_FULL_47_8]
MSKGIKEIKDRGRVIAIAYSKSINPDGIQFFTPGSYPLQIGLHNYPRTGKRVPAHFHPHLKYNVKNTQEFLYVEKGVVDVIVYNLKWQKKAKLKLSAGDSVLFVDCGHEVIFHKGSRMMEVKQGPYPGDKKAKIFRDKK